MLSQKLKDVRPDYQQTNIYSFARQFLNSLGREFSGKYQQLYQASVDHLEEFWAFWLEKSGLIYEPGKVRLQNPDKMTGGQYFVDTKINYAENLLETYTDDDQIAAIYRDHLPQTRRSLTVRELKQLVSLYDQVLAEYDVGIGDRVAAYLGNTLDAAAFCLATAKRGAIWSIIGPTNETKSVLDRFTQIKPKVFIGTDENIDTKSGDIIDRLITTREIAAGLTSIEKVIIVPRYPDRPQKDLSGFDKASYIGELTAGLNPQKLSGTYERVAFNDPLFILYSSGTTGNPKCIVHGVGGTLLQLTKEHQLHQDVKPGDVAFFQTNSEWMMWHYNLSYMASNATVIFSDVNVRADNNNILFDIAYEENVRQLGSFAGFFNMLERRGFTPRNKNALESVRHVMSTGSRLMPQTFHYFYETFGLDGEVASISGGTDIVSCFVLGCCAAPVHAGESQVIGLGMNVKIFDSNGRPCETGQSGELVCCSPFPSMPVFFWGDEDGSRYHDAYFDVFDNVWRHGDEAMLCETGGVVILGRSDDTLNINGNRIGPVEIIDAVEQLDEVVEAAVVGRNIDGSDYPVLFVVLAQGKMLDEALKQKISEAILERKPAYCVPPQNYFFAVDGLPKAGVKLSLIAIKQAVNGKPFKGKDKMTPENQKYLEAIAALDLVNTQPSRQKPAA